jgi:hypothetical protein
MKISGTKESLTNILVLAVYLLFLHYNKLREKFFPFMTTETKYIFLLVENRTCETALMDIFGKCHYKVSRKQRAAMNIIYIFYM